jgi:hypothetical protein
VSFRFSTRQDTVVGIESSVSSAGQNIPVYYFGLSTNLNVCCNCLPCGRLVEEEEEDKEDMEEE